MREKGNRYEHADSVRERERGVWEKERERRGIGRKKNKREN